MRAVSTIVALQALASCSFEHGRLATGNSDSGASSDGSAGDASARPVDALDVDAFVPASNVVASGAGATLVTFTSEYCPPSNPPALCQSGYWNHTNINDGQNATGDNQTAYRAAWASTLKQNNNPEVFELAFASGRAALIDHVVIQNWGRGNGSTLYYSTHAIISGRAPGSSTFTTLVDTDLATTETPQTFTPSSPALIDRIRLSITDGQRTDYWEMGEFEAWGWLQ